MSARSASRCELTETYSPTAIDIDPATRPATPATKMASVEAEDAATPIMRLAVDTIASSDPSNAARSHPARTLRCLSRCDREILRAPSSESAQQEQDQDDHQYRPNDARGAVPVRVIPPAGQTAEQEQKQEDQQDQSHRGASSRIRSVGSLARFQACDERRE